MKLFPLFILSLLLIAGCTQQSQSQTPSTSTTSNTPTNPPIQVYPPPANSSTTTPSTSSGPTSQEFTYYSGGWTIYGTDYLSQANSPTTTIILLPGLGQSRSSFPVSFIQSLHDNFPDADVVSIDTRGSGQSTNLGTWQSFTTDNFITMKGDIIDLDTKYITQTHPSVTQYYVIGVDMGATQAMVATTQDKKIYKIAMLSPAVNLHGVDITTDIQNYPHAMFLAGSSGDSSSQVSQVAAIANPIQVTQQTYSGSSHGTDMFSDTSVANDLLTFLKAS